MFPSTHRIRTQEKRLIKKLLFTVAFGIGSVFIVLFVGLPLLAKIVVTLSSFRIDSESSSNTTENIILQPPVLNPIAEATNTAQINVSGFSDKESTVKILINNIEQLKVTTDKEGVFSTNKVKLIEGENMLTVQLVKGEKTSNTSSPITIYYIKNPPKLDISAPGDGEKFSGEENKVEVRGETDSGNKVHINDRFVIVDREGKFSYTINLSNGDNIIHVTSVDKAGNKTEIERKVTYNP